MDDKIYQLPTDSAQNIGGTRPSEAAKEEFAKEQRDKFASMTGMGRVAAMALDYDERNSRPASHKHFSEQDFEQEGDCILRPLGDRVIIKRMEVADKTEGGIYIPTQAKEVPLEGVILAVGEGKYLESGQLVPPPLRVGQRIVFSRYSGSEIRIGVEDLVILNVNDIQGVYRWEPLTSKPAVAADFPTVPPTE